MVRVHTFKLEYLWRQLANLDQIICVASLGWGKGCIRFWGRLDTNSGFHGNRKPPLAYNGENDVSTISRLFLILSFSSFLAGNEDMHKISDKFKFRPDRTTDYGVSCPWVSNNSRRLIMGKCCLHACSFIFDWIVIKVADNQDRHKVRMNLILGRIRLLTSELLALEWPKFYTFELEYLWGQLANLDQILYVASLGVGKGCIMFWGRLDQNSGVYGNRKPPLTYDGENGVSTFSWLLLIRSFLYSQVTRTCIKSRMSSNFGQIGPLTTELADLECLDNFP